MLKRSLPWAHYSLIGSLLVLAVLAAEMSYMTRTGRRPKASSRAASFDMAPGNNARFSHDPLTPIIFKGTGAQIIAGRESHQVYCFSSHDPEQMIDARDAEALLKTGLFRINN